MTETRDANASNEAPLHAIFASQIIVISLAFAVIACDMIVAGIACFLLSGQDDYLLATFASMDVLDVVSRWLLLLFNPLLASSIFGVILVNLATHVLGVAANVCWMKGKIHLLVAYAALCFAWTMAGLILVCVYASLSGAVQTIVLHGYQDFVNIYHNVNENATAIWNRVRETFDCCEIERASETDSCKRPCGWFIVDLSRSFQKTVLGSIILCMLVHFLQTLLSLFLITRLLLQQKIKQFLTRNDERRQLNEQQALEKPEL